MLQIWALSVPMPLRKASVLEIPLDKQLTACCLVETHTECFFDILASTYHGPGPYGPGP